MNYQTLIPDLKRKKDRLGSNKTSLLLVMKILMLRKSLKFNVIGIHSCVPSLL